MSNLSSSYPYGPYNLPWHTSPHGAYVCDIGLGIGLVKVAGHVGKAIPFCPAVARLDPARDPELTEWDRQSGNQSTGGLTPDFPPCAELEREQREWMPHVLHTRYHLGGTAMAQQLVVDPDGVHCRMEADAPVALPLEGLSEGPCKLRRLANGLHVIEGGLRVRPLEYVIRFSTPPTSIRSGDTELDEGRFVHFTEQAPWSFRWDTGIETLEISVLIGRSFAGGTFAAAEQEMGRPTGALPACGSAKPRPPHVSVDAPAAAHGGRTRGDPVLSRGSMPGPTVSFFDRLHAQAAQWENYFANDVPAIAAPDARLDELSRYLAWVFRSNTLHGGGILPYPYSIPKYTFTAWWMWDTAKSAIAGAWYGDRDVAWGGLLNTENLQYPAPHDDEGVITNSARFHGVDCWYSPDAASDRYHCMPYMIPEEHGSGTHPPMFALALWSLWSVDGNDTRMSRLLPNVLAMDRYFDRMRASETVPGLLLVRRWSDSGMDNSKRWANQNNRALHGRTHYDDTDWEMPVISVDVNVYSIVEKQCLAAMCRAAGMDAEAERLATQAAEREATLHRELWDAEKGSYFDRDEARGQFTSIVAPTNLSPLMLDNLPPDRIAPLRGWLFDPKHFWSDYPIPSISMADPDFEPERGYWMGPVWMSYPMDILRGLFKHDPASAHKLLDRLLNLMLKDGTPAVHENYNPLNGQALECPNFSWNGQLVDIVLRDMFGIARRDGKVTATSTGVPKAWNKWAVRGVTLHGKRYTIEARRTGDGWTHDVRNA